MRQTFIFIIAMFSLQFAIAQDTEPDTIELPWVRGVFPLISDKDYRDLVRSLTLEEPYYLGDDSRTQAGVPEGTLIPQRHVSTDIYPGVERNYWVYVPAQYDPEKEASLIIFQDGPFFLNEDEFNATVVLDNLIHKNEIPVTIGLFIAAGETGPGYPLLGGSDNRSIEYDAINDRYARFLVEEMIPLLSEEWSLSSKPEDTIIAGISSGGICAFNAAWHMPHRFGKVISFVGSFTNIRGGHNYPSMIRKNPRKVIKVFLQASSNDVDHTWGNWPLANQQMASALEYAGYDYKFVYGEGGHSLAHGGSIFPDIMRWFWEDYSDDN